MDQNSAPSSTISAIAPVSVQHPSEDQSAGLDALPENGTYTAKEDVALYIHTYGHLMSIILSLDGDSIPAPSAG